MNVNTRTSSVLFLTLFTGTIASSIAFSDDTEPTTEKPIAFEVSGTVESIKQQSITAGTQQFKSLKIDAIVEHGARVEPDMSIIRFEPEAYEKKLAQSERDLQLAEIAFEDEVFANNQATQQMELDRQAADRDWDSAKEAFANYMEVDRERSIKSAEFNLKQSLATLMNAKEELDQLEQMYKEDDLTEESEEIVLKRAQQAVESAQFRHESASIQAKRTIEQEVPKTTERQKETLQRAEHNYQKTIRALEINQQRRRIELDKKQATLDEQRQNHEELVNDKALLEIHPSFAGILVYGELQRGKLSDKPPQLQVGSTVNSDQVLFTIMNPNELQLRLIIPEANLSQVKVGDQCTASFTSIPNQTFPAKVKTISRVPFASTQYDCVVSLADSILPKGLLPLMSCKVAFPEKPKLTAKPAVKKRQPMVLKKVESASRTKQSNEASSPEELKEGSLNSIEVKKGGEEE